MDAKQFVDLLKISVRDAAASEELDVLRSPPGRRPSSDLIERSRWYNSLDGDQKKLLASIVGDVADRAVFGFLCVLDGIRTIEDGTDKGRLELRYVKDRSHVLNSPDGEFLHDLW